MQSIKWGHCYVFLESTGTLHEFRPFFVFFRRLLNCQKRPKSRQSEVLHCQFFIYIEALGVVNTEIVPLFQICLLRAVVGLFANHDTRPRANLAGNCPLPP